MTKIKMPEPVTEFYDEVDNETVPCYSASQLQAYADAKVKEALERAEDAVTVLYESEELPFLADITKAILGQIA